MIASRIDVFRVKRGVGCTVETLIFFRTFTGQQISWAPEKHTIQIRHVLANRMQNSSIEDSFVASFMRDGLDWQDQNVVLNKKSVILRFIAILHLYKDASPSCVIAGIIVVHPCVNNQKSPSQKQIAMLRNLLKAFLIEMRNFDRNWFKSAVDFTFFRCIAHIFKNGRADFSRLLLIPNWW